MEIERDTALRGWWMEYDRSEAITEWRQKYTSPTRIFISDSELRVLYPIIKKYGKPKLDTQTEGVS